MKRTIPALVEAVVREHFAGDPIESVTTVPGFDHEDDPLLYVTLVIDSVASPMLDPDKMLGIIGKIRDRLIARSETVFPILTFMSKRDALELAAEAA